MVIIAVLNANMSNVFLYHISLALFISLRDYIMIVSVKAFPSELSN